MQKETLSLFHEHLLLFLQDDLQKKKKSEGWDEKIDSGVRSYRDLLSHSMRGQEPLRLQEIIDKHQHLFQQRGPVHLEHKILEAFPEQEMKRLGFAPLRMVRGLPRLFSKSAPIFSSRMHPAFSHLPTLKRSALSKPLYSMYAGQPLPKDAKVAIFAKGGADALLAEEMAHQMTQAFPSLEVRILVFPRAVEGRELRSFDLWLLISPEDPQIQDAIEGILAEDDVRTQPKIERIGRCGPSRGAAHTMGLHFLERGVFLKSFRSSTLADLENGALLAWLFERASALHEIEEYRKERRFFLSRLSSQTGVFIYLHALFKSLEWDGKEIDLCIPDAKALLDYLQARQAANEPVLDKSYGIGEIAFSIGSETSSIEISPKGKGVRIFCPGTLSEADGRRLLLLSEDFTGVSGDEGVVDAVSANKGFFYDPSTLSRSLVKDLIALAENRIAAHRSTLSILRLYVLVYEQQYKPEESEWVDEISIQSREKMPLLEIAEKIGCYLQDPDALAGFKKLNRLIAKEHSCNGFLLHMVERAVCHRRRPQVARFEEEAVLKFIHNQIPLAHLAQHLQDAFVS